MLCVLVEERSLAEDVALGSEEVVALTEGLDVSLPGGKQAVELGYTRHVLSIGSDVYTTIQ